MGNRSMRVGGRTPVRKLAMALAAVALVAAGCATDDAGSDAGTSDDALDIVVTTSIWGDVVRSVVGDDANVMTVMPIGADPHDFTASSQQVASMQEADLVVANGLGLEEGLEDVLEAIETDGGNVLELAPFANPIPFRFEGGHEDDHGDEGHEDETSDEDDHSDEGHEDETSDEGGHEGDDGHDHDGDDPHVWLDPDRVARAAMALAEALAELDGSVDWIQQAEDYVDSLEAAGTAADEILASLSDSQRKLVTNHEALGYFADRFDFEVVGVVIPGGSTLADPSSAELAELVETMEDEGVRAIFGETSSTSDLTDAVADELGDDVVVVELFTGSLGEEGSGADTVPGMIRTNAELIAEALNP